MRAPVARGPALLLLAGALVVALPVLAVAAVRRADDRPPLRRELERVITVVDATATEVLQSHEVLSSPPNADPARADDPQDTPGYDRCDAWRDWILPGWHAGHGYVIRLRDDRDGEDLLRATERYWTGLGYDVERRRWDGGAGVLVELDHSDYGLHVDWVRREAALGGGTRCLPLR